jgi:hypothetical protein
MRRLDMTTEWSATISWESDATMGLPLLPPVPGSLKKAWPVGAVIIDWPTPMAAAVGAVTAS